MRVKLSTSSPLPRYNCWFVLTEKNESQTVHHLRKKIVKDLELNSEPCLLQLSMDGFNLLPQSNIQGLLRDGDLINVEQVNSIKPITKKRKISSIEEKKDTLQLTVKKSKKEEPTKQKKSEKIKEKSTKSEKKKEKLLKSDKPSKSEKKKVSEKTLQKTLKEQNTSLPFEGKLRTKKRNMRRRDLKRRLRTIADPTILSEPIIEPVTHHELQIQNLNISHAEPLQLLKKNKNKKKNHMKQMEQRSHVYYPQEIIENTPEETINTSVQDSNKNMFGRAFVTFVESEKNYTERSNSKYSPQEYPIHRVPTLFYANQGVPEDELMFQPETEIVHLSPVDEQQPELIDQQPEQIVNEKSLNYDDFPDANFTDNIPSIGTKLAIKTLELTSTYTPEISDWKQVILKQIDSFNKQVTFEFLPGFGKATTKGGKFDNKKNRKKYDDWYEQEEEEEEETEATFEMTDIFAMKTMS